MGKSGESMPRNTTASLSSSSNFADDDDDDDEEDEDSFVLLNVFVPISNARVLSRASSSNDDRSSDDIVDDSFTGNNTHPLLTRTVRNTGDDGSGLDTYGASSDRSMDDMCISPSFVPGAYSSTFNVPSRYGLAFVCVRGWVGVA